MHRRLAAPAAGFGAEIEVDRHQRRGRMHGKPHPARQVANRLRQRRHRCLGFRIERARHEPQPRAEHRAQHGDQRRIVGQHLGTGVQRGKALHRVRPAPQQRRRAGADRGMVGAVELRGQPRPLAALRRAADAHANRVALAHCGAALAVGQEPFGAADRDERAAQRRQACDHPPAMQIAHAIGRPRPPDRIVQKPRGVACRNPHLARAGGGEHPHGSG
jgi:hypothetical protein